MECCRGRMWHMKSIFFSSVLGCVFQLYFRLKSSNIGSRLRLQIRTRGTGRSVEFHLVPMPCFRWPPLLSALRALPWWQGLPYSEESGHASAFHPKSSWVVGRGGIQIHANQRLRTKEGNVAPRPRPVGSICSSQDFAFVQSFNNTVIDAPPQCPLTFQDKSELVPCCHGFEWAWMGCGH